MQEEWWEGIATFLCQYWWIILIILLLGLTAYFTRDYWMPALQDLFALLPETEFSHAA